MNEELEKDLDIAERYYEQHKNTEIQCLQAQLQGYREGISRARDIISQHEKRKQD